MRHIAFTCTTHQLNRTICKCEKKAVKIQSNSCINSTILGNVGFDTEMIVIRNGKRMMRTILTYDRFASHTTMSDVVKDELCLETKDIGDLSINTYNGIKLERGFQTSATIDGLHDSKIDFIISTCSQKIPAYQYDVPMEWIEKYNLSDPPTSTFGLNMITIGKDNCQLFPTVIEVLNGVCLSKSNISGKYILSGRAISSDDSLINANKTIMNHNAVCDDEDIQGCQVQEETAQLPISNEIIKPQCWL